MKVRSVSRNRYGPNRLLRLVPGQLVRGRVIARLGEGRFRVGFVGRHFDASSDLPLEPGQRLTARVEMGDSKVFLRIFEDAEREVYTQESPEEIRRILEGLGNRPTSLDITEFQERLDRYRIHGALAGSEPSDVWVLAILWTRGIRGGADAFALLSYYLRSAASRPTKAPHLPNPADFLSLLGRDKTVTSARDEEDNQDLGRQNLNQTNSPLKERTLEAVTFLNKKSGIGDQYLHCVSPRNNFCALVTNQNNIILGRWSDNPALPSLLVEAGQAQGRIGARVHYVRDEETDDQEGVAHLVDRWETGVGQMEFEVANTELIGTADPEKLRFLLWRKWHSTSVRDLRV